MTGHTIAEAKSFLLGFARIECAGLYGVESMASKSIAPSVTAVAFNCPHCGVLAAQHWYRLLAKFEERAPAATRNEFFRQFEATNTQGQIREAFRKVHEKELSGLVSLKEIDGIYSTTDVRNVYLSSCFSCEDVAVWVHNKLVFPPLRKGPEPNPDLPDSVRKDYEEAGTILNLSPRGAAALLRLAIQKLCIELGEKGEKIDNDIASLVQKGLSPLVQKALDAVRVIGNEAVHPGTIDLKDDTETATNLFGAVNIIAEQMISNPKHVEELYSKLPEEKKKAIEKRDRKPGGES
jgi:hypothetical protein